MRKILLIATSLLLCASAYAQPMPVQRVSDGTHQADIQVQPINDTRTQVNISNPNGSEKIVMDIVDDPQAGIIQMTAKDMQTGEQRASISGKKGEYMDAIQSYPDGTKMEMHLQKNGADLSGSIKTQGTDFAADIQVENGTPIGTLTTIENGVENKISFMADGTYQVVLQDAKTKKVLYTAKGTEEYSYLYDDAGQLIAEGEDIDELDTIKIYNQKAFEKYLELINDDEED